MRIAIEGCTHGELDKIYETIAHLEQQSGEAVDLLITCGDFQSIRNVADLKCMACPDKYKDLCSFYKYYSGEKKAPILTLFIGGNHEASNYLQELPYGGWVAPNIFYLGYANVIEINGIRIGGLSGIYNGSNYLKGHFEIPPYNESTMRSVYHIRNLDTFRLKQLASNPPDIMLSHDWPAGVYDFGDKAGLLRKKKHFIEDVQKNTLGSRPAREVLDILKPEYWFSAHLHVKFAALVPHEDSGKTTKFLSLDKCLPQRQFLQVIEVGERVEKKEDIEIKFDPVWLAILKSTNHLVNSKQTECHMPGPGGKERYNFKPQNEELKTISEIFEGDLTIPTDFKVEVPPFDPKNESKADLSWTVMPNPRRNRQTEWLCERLGIVDPLELALKRQNRTFENDLSDEGKDDDSMEAEKSVTEPKKDMVVNYIPRPKLSESLPAPINDSQQEEPLEEESLSTLGFVEDVAPNRSNIQEPETTTSKKKLKRRNAAAYSNNEDN